jgi:hypothetical protein
MDLETVRLLLRFFPGIDAPDVRLRIWIRSPDFPLHNPAFQLKHLCAIRKG